jgi:hypothetical protein
MFTNNLLKRPKLDAKRKKAIAYFNNKFPNSPVVEKSGFWTFNRVKILLSASVALLAASVVAFKFAGNGEVFLALLGCTYILAPFICLKLNKYPASTKIKSIKFIKVTSKVYRQSELPSGLAIASAFLTVLTVILFKLFDTHGLIVYLVSVTPFLMYHLLCFIGDHPLAIFTSIRYLPATNNSGYNVPYSPQNSTFISANSDFATSESMHSDNDYCPYNGMPGRAGWDLHYSGYDYGINSHDNSSTPHNS